MMADIKRKVPNLRFKGFTDDWEQHKLGEIITYYNGKSHEEQFRNAETQNFELVTLKSIDENGNLCSSEKYIDSTNNTLSKNDLIMVLSEQNKGLVGMTTLIPRDNYYVLNQRVALLKLHKNNSPFFLTDAINQHQIFFERMSAGTKVQNISKSNVENFNLYIPNYSEQKEVGHIIALCQNIITLQQRKLELLKEIKKGLLQKIFADKDSKRPILRFEGFNNEWECKKLGDIARMYQPKTITSSKLASTGYPVFGANGYIGFYSEANHMDDQVTISARGEGTGTPSYVKGPVWITGNSMVINVDNSGIDKAFLFNNLSAHSLKKYVTGGAQPQLTREVLKSIPIMLSGQNEQIKIGALSKRLIKIISVQQNKLSKLKDVKKALLQQMFI